MLSSLSAGFWRDRFRSEPPAEKHLRRNGYAACALPTGRLQNEAWKQTSDLEGAIGQDKATESGAMVGNVAAVLLRPLADKTCVNIPCVAC